MTTGFRIWGRLNMSLRASLTRGRGSAVVFLSAATTLSCGADRSETTEARELVAESAFAADYLTQLQQRFRARPGEQREGTPLIGQGTIRRVGLAGDPLLVQTEARGVPPALSVKLALRANEWSRLKDESSGVAVSVRTIDATDAAASLGAGLVLYERALLGAHAMVSRVTPTTLEDYVVFETGPAEPWVSYELRLHDVAGLRLVANTLELVDGTGAPRLRVAPPYLVDSQGLKHIAELSIGGCAADVSPVGPWGRPPVAPGAESCTLRVAWEAHSVQYPAVLDPAWSVTGEMVLPRALHSATLLKDGRVLVAGARWENSPPSELFDPKTLTWAATSPLNTPRANAAAVTLQDGRALVVGGSCGPPGCPNSLGAEIYEAGTGKWQDVPNTPEVFARMTATRLLDGRVLAAGGCNTDNAGGCGFAQAYLFDPAGDTWKKLPDVPAEATPNGAASHGRHTASLLTDGRVLLVGGISPGAPPALRLTNIFNPATESWSPGPPLLQPRGDHAAVTLADGRVLVVSGYQDPSDLYSGFPRPDGEIYDPQGNSWTLTAMTPRGHSGAALRDDGSVILAGGGEPTAELFWPPALASHALALPGTQRFFHTVTPLDDGRVLVAGGGTSDAKLLELGDGSDFQPASPSSVLLDDAAFDPGADAGPSDGGAGSGGGAGTGGSESGDDKGCACRAGSHSPGRAPVLAWVVVCGFAFVRRRRPADQPTEARR